MLTWISLPVKNNPKGVALAVGSILLAIITVWLLTASWGAGVWASGGWGMFAGLILFFSLRSFFFPTTIRLDKHGITVKEPLFTRIRPWSKCKSLHQDRFGVLVSPFAFSTRLENYRGVYLRFVDNKDEVLEFLKRRMEIEQGESEDRP